MLSLLESGGASHNVMFILGTYFTHLGLSVDEAVELFRRSPHFSEEKTRYQLEFLAGENGGTRYSCPNCGKIKSYGLCEWDCGVKHPLSYGRRGNAKGNRSQGVPKVR
jgi:DNA primase large subunit